MLAGVTRRNRGWLTGSTAILVAAAIVASMVVLAVLVLRGVIGAEPARPPIEAVAEGLAPQTTVQQRIDAATLIVRGTVGEPRPSRWTTPSGELPESANWETVAKRDWLIYTDYPIEVERVLKGSYVRDTILLRVKSGRAGRDSYTTENHPVLRPGEEVIAMLTPDEHPRTRGLGPAHYAPLFGFQGIFRVEGDRAIVERKGDAIQALPLSRLQTRISRSRPGVHLPEFVTKGPRNRE